MWIPRRFLGEISLIEDPVVIVGLVKELEYRSGAILPHQRRVIEMPLAVGDRPHSPVTPRPEPAPVVGIRLEPGAETRVGRLILGALLAGVIGTLAVVMATREGAPRAKFAYPSADSALLDLNTRDDYFSIVHKLGPPAGDNSTTRGGDLEFRSLWYPQRSCYVVLMSEPNAAQCTTSARWIKIGTCRHSVNADTASMLRGLPKF